MNFDLETYLKDLEIAKEKEAFLNKKNESRSGKLNKITSESQNAKDELAKAICFNIYFESLPLGPEYKTANRNELMKEFTEAVNSLDSRGFYNNLKSNKSLFCKRLTDAIDTYVERTATDFCLNINDISYNDIKFESVDEIDAGDGENVISVVSRDLNADNVSDVVSDNVKKIIVSEITRAKESKEKMKEIEKELANDIKVDSEEKVEEAVSAKMNRFGQKKFTPSLFEAIMINKCNNQDSLMIEGKLSDDVNLYDALSVFENVSDSKDKSLNDSVIFIESVKEYTYLSTLNALNIKHITPLDSKELALQYAIKV